MVISEAEKLLCTELLPICGEDAHSEAREILREVCGGISPFCEISDKQLEICRGMIRRREGGEPLQYIFGHWEFYGYDFSVGEGVLIPRPETELLCELAIKHLKTSGGCFADLCAGSGCIGITVALQTGCNGHGIELSDAAFGYFEQNIQNNKAENLLTAIHGDIFDSAIINRFEDGSLSAVLSNPPYISRKDMQTLQTEVRYEPELALYGGEDGLDYYRRIFALWGKKLKSGGLFAVEIGEEQASAVCGFMQDCGFEPKVIKDYDGHDRIVAATAE